MSFDGNVRRVAGSVADPGCTLCGGSGLLPVQGRSDPSVRQMSWCGCTRAHPAEDASSLLPEGGGGYASLWRSLDQESGNRDRETPELFAVDRDGRRIRLEDIGPPDVRMPGETLEALQDAIREGRPVTFDPPHASGPASPTREIIWEITEHPSRRPMPQIRPHVLDMKLDYNNEYSRMRPGGSVEVTVRLLLPPDCDPNDFLTQLKEMGTTPVRRDADLFEQLRVAGNRAVALEESGRNLGRRLVEVTEAKNAAEQALFQLRMRMNAAIQALEDEGVARDLYRELVRAWSERLVEGAAFTAAEGDDLVESLVQTMQYINVARKALLPEPVPGPVKPCSPEGKAEDHLF